MNDDRLRRQLIAQKRQLRRLPVRIAPPSPAGTLIRWVTLDAPTYRGQPPVTGDLYGVPQISSLQNPGVAPLEEDVDVLASAGHGWYLAGVSILHPVVASSGAWEMIGSGIWHSSAVLDEDLHAGGQAQSGLLTVYAPWSGTDEPIANAGDTVGISWNDVTLQWEATLAGCQDESIVAE